MVGTDFSQHSVAEPARTYAYEDHQDTYVSGTRLKPDGVLYYSGQVRSARSIHMVIEAKLASHTESLPDVVLGQLAEYARTVWTEQPTRIFVPVILLHGANMTLFVFARSGYYRVEMGTYLFTNAVRPQYKALAIMRFLQKLWFLIIQPPDRFGHFADVSIDYKSLRFLGSVLDSKVEVAGSGKTLDVKLGDRIARDVPLIRRTAYLIKATYCNKPVVLKYSWTPVDRLPEGAIYSSGILVKNFFGYRLEYLLMEDCADVINRTVSCLVEAAKAGVLHRDISAGNITICNGQVRVIDWGYAKLTQPDAPEIKDIADEWGFDLGNVTKNEIIHDGMTGTPLFMSIRVLLGRSTRSVIDDIESLFYVAMYALSHLSEGPSASSAFKVQDNNTAAYVKLGLVIRRKSYLKIFGVKECSDEVRAQLDLLYQLLFCRNGQFIGEELAEEEAEVRVVDTSIMRKIIGSGLADRIYGSQDDDSSAMPAGENDTPAVKASAKRKTRAAKTRKPAPKKPKPAPKKQKPAPKKPKPADNSNNPDSIRNSLRSRKDRSA
ncbi:hypothetical protein GGF49_001823 [Coemansia sp. RSA 1853]|nr:hypothetical protein GGF49_001823 [Coemansia sp. RSA 1853]